MKHILLLFNPKSGRFSQKRLQVLIDRMKLRGWKVSTRQTKPYGKITTGKFLADLDDFSNVVVAGGDGTLNGVLNAMPHLEKAISIVPWGTGNDYTKNFGRVPHNYEILLENIETGMYKKVSLGSCNDRLFVNGVGSGFDGQIVHNMQKSPSWFSGHAAYYSQVISILGGYKEKKLKFIIDGKQFEEDVFLLLAGLGNVFGGGFRILPTASVFNDYFQICHISAIHPVRRFLNLNRLKRGKHAEIPEVTFHEGKEIYIETPLTKSQIDGELLEENFIKLKINDEKMKFSPSS